MAFKSLPPDVEGMISSFMQSRDSNRLRAASRSSILPKLISYSSNYRNFIEAHMKAARISSVSRNKTTLEEMIEKYYNINENASLSDNEKLNKFNEGIKSYLQIINKSPSYLYGLAQLFSYKSGLTDLVQVNHTKYKILEFETYKLYLLNSFITKNKKDIVYLQDAIKNVLNRDLNGIKDRDKVTYIKKASPSLLLCSSFLNYYLCETDETLEFFLTLYLKCYKEGFTKPIVTALTPKMISASSNIERSVVKRIIIKLKETIFNNCIQFLITDEEAISQYTPVALKIDFDFT